MAFMKIRGAQIKDHQIVEAHIDPVTGTKGVDWAGGLSEDVLRIDWQSHADDILGEKLIVDLIQKNAVTMPATAATTLDLTDANAISGAPAASTTVSGVCVYGTSGDYTVKIRDAVSGEPLVNAQDKEVYGKLTAVSGTGPYTYTLSFFSLVSDVETAFEMPANKVIDIIYPQRFSLWAVPENFLENERFVDGAVDISAYQNLLQMAADVFGNTYVYDNDGNFQNFFANDNTLVEEMTAQTSGATNTTVRATTIIDEVVTARGTMDSLDERLDVSLNEDGSLKVGSLIHQHVFKDAAIIVDDTSTVDFVFAATGELDTPKAGDTYNVYINGVKQIVGGTNSQATISIVSDTVTVTLSTHVLMDSDMIELEAIIFGVDN